ncbi:hypothetical protein [Nocardia fluminea]|uniref:hypothetical protein n=1 Tax=Nocardia fluminea TaxID=134984 RepID=UPI003D11D713
MITSDHCIEIYDSANKAGTGYRVGDRLVLTAAHVVNYARPEERTIIRVRRLGEAALSDAHVVWLRAGPVDVALLEVQSTGWGSHVNAVWGRCILSAPDTKWQAIGYPDATVRSDAVREPEHLTGSLSPLGQFKSKRLSLNVENWPEFVDDEISDGESAQEKTGWSGASGAAVFCNSAIVGVITHSVTNFGHRRLSATRISELFDDADFVDLIEKHTGRSPSLVPAEVWQLFDIPDHRLAGPASLLVARNRTAPFVGRKNVLETLKNWADTEDAASARLLTAKGGQGKTRLALELVDSLRRSGWVAGFLRHDASEADVRRLVYGTIPTIVVVDYAEGRSSQLEIVADVARISNSRCRILMLARAAGDWFTAPRSELLRWLFEDCPTLGLPELAEDDDVDAAVEWVAVCRGFASRLNEIVGYEHVDWLNVAEASWPSVPEVSRDGTVLGKHEAALAALLRLGVPNESIEGNDRDVLLAHEKKYWNTLAQARSLEFRSQRTATQIVASATLWGAKKPIDAQRVVARTEGSSDMRRDDQYAVADWVAELYPGSSEYWGSLEPDRLAEQLVAGQLLDDPAFFEAAASVATPIQFDRALTQLCRVVDSNPEVGDVFSGVIRQSFGIGIPSAIRVSPAVDSRHVLLSTIDDLVGEDPALTFDEILAIDAEFERNIHLHSRRSAATISEKVVGAWANRIADGDMGAAVPFARAMIGKAGRLFASGRVQAAVQAAQDAEIQLRTQYSVDSSCAWDLISALHNQADYLDRMNSTEHALEKALEALRVFEEVAPGGDMSELHPDFVRVLASAARRLALADRVPEAVSIADRAVDIARHGVGKVDRLRFLSALAYALGVQAKVLVSEGEDIAERHRGVSAAGEAVSVYKELCELFSHAYRGQYASALTNHAIIISSVDTAIADPIAPAQEGTRIARRMYDEEPHLHADHLIGSLKSLGYVFLVMGEFAAAIPVLFEALEVRIHPADESASAERREHSREIIQQQIRWIFREDPSTATAAYEASASGELPSWVFGASDELL